MFYARVLMKSGGKCSKSCTLCAVYEHPHFQAKNGGEKSSNKMEKRRKNLIADYADSRGKAKKNIEGHREYREKSIRKG